MRPEDGAAVFQAVPEFAVVEDFAIEHDGIAARLIPHRLMRVFGGVDHSQPPMAQTYPLIYIYVLEIRPAFLQTACGSRDVDLIEFANKIKSKYSRNTAHKDLPAPAKIL